MNRPAILVTGGAGFIGSHLCETLLEAQYTVICVDDLSTGFRENIEQLLVYPEFQFIPGDICDIKIFDNIRQQIQVIVHLAAKKIPRYGNALATLTTNNDGTKNTLEIAKKFGCRFILASTSDVYGKGKPPFKENDDLVIGPSDIRRWSYATSKIFDEHLTMANHQENNIETVILRFFGTYGPRHHRSWWGGPQAVFIEQALKKEPFSIHGDGHQTRSFTFIADLISGIKAAIESNAAVGQIINLGSEEEISILNLAKSIGKLVNNTDNPQMLFTPYESFGGKYEDVMRRLPDITKARELLAFEPKFKLIDGLKQTIDWQRKF